MIDCMKIALIAFLLAGAVAVLNAAGPPEAAISNAQIQAKLYLPDVKDGYYRGTRFDWSGVVYSLRYQGHDYYGPWYQKRRDNVRDFIYEGGEIVAGPCSAITGPVEEYAPLGYDDAQPGGSFVKIGIGVLRKPDAAPYDHYRMYEVADGGKWTVHRAKDRIEFVQQVNSPDGYGYVYTKTLRLENNKPEMVLEHRLRNTGKRPIVTDGYNHNFLVLDHQPPGPGYSITFPFEIKTNRPPNAALAKVEGERIAYVKKLEGKDTVATPIEGFSDTPKDYDFDVESTGAGAGIRVQSDRAMSKAALWSIRSVVAVEPYVALSIQPGQEFTWTFNYDFYTLGSK